MIIFVGKKERYLLNIEQRKLARTNDEQNHAQFELLFKNSV